MIELNKIGLNQVQLNRLYLNTLSSEQRIRSGGGTGDGFPVLPGDVTRWHFGGLTNEMMAAMDDPRLEDADGKGRFLSFKNFLWAGMSGVGGYSNEIVQTTFKFTPDKYNMAAIKSGFKHMNFRFKVTGLQPGNKLTLMYAGEPSSVAIYGNWTNDGIYVVNTDIKNIEKPVYFYNGYGAVSGEFTIEILPLYPGFILGDGVDDYAVTEEQLNFEDTYTVYTAFIPFQNDPVSNMRLCGKDSSKDFYMNYNDLYAVSFFSIKGVSTHLSKGFNLICCKRTTNKLLIKNLITGQQGSISSDALIHNPGLYYLWRDVVGRVYAKAAIAGQIIDNGHFATDEEDVKVLAWYKKEYPWLFFDQAWTVAGKSNEDADRDTIANITGNGNDLILQNFGFAEESGYGLYETNFMNWVDSHIATFTRTPSKINVTAVLKEANATFTYSTESRLKQRIKVTGLPEGVSLILGRTNFIFYTIAQDGIYDIDVTDDSGSSSPIIGYRINKILDSCDITIEQISEYEGYLVSDGVDDKIMSSNFRLQHDFTVVGEWQFLPPDKTIYCGMSKGTSFILYNFQEGLMAFINQQRTGTELKGVKGLKAICSDGRVYNQNWDEIRIMSGELSFSDTRLQMGWSGDRFTKIAFKNLGIYNNKILSKEDCIKAYNYLQTLKAK